MLHFIGKLKENLKKPIEGLILIKVFFHFYFFR